MLGCPAREECGSGGNVNGVMAVPEVDPGIVPAIPVVGKGKGGKADDGPRGTRDPGPPCHSRECEKPDLASGPALSLLDSRLRGNDRKNRFAKRLSH